MANDIIQRIIFDDSQVIKGLTNENALLSKTTSLISEMEDGWKTAFKEAIVAGDQAAKVVDHANDALTKTIVTTNQAKSANSSFKEGIKSLAGEINVMGRNLGATVENLKRKAQAMKLVSTAIGGTNNALKLFKIALVSTGLGAVVVILGSMIAFLLKTEKGMNKVSVVLAGLGAVVKVFVDRTLAFGNAIFELFSGHVSQAFNDAKAAVSGLGAEIRKEVNSAVELEQFLQRLKKQKENLESVDAKISLRLAKDREIISDTNNLYVDRLKAANDQIEQLAILNKEKIDVAAKETQAAATALLASRADEDLKKKAREASNAQSALEADLALEQRLAVKTRNNLEAEHNQQLQQAKEKHDQINASVQAEVDKLLELFRKAKLEQLSPEERLQAEFEFAKNSLKETVKNLDITNSQRIKLEKSLDEFLISLEKEKNENIQKLRDKDLKQVEKLDKDKAKSAVDGIKSITEGFQFHSSTVEKTAHNIFTAFADLKDKFAEALNIDPEVLNQIIDSIGQSMASIFSSITAGTDASIEANDKLLGSLKEQEKEADDQLQKEIERQEAGLANNVAGKKKEIEAIKKQEADAEKERQKLRKKQIAEQAIADSITQVSNIITMSSNILASPGVSLLGPAGIQVALATIAAFIAIFSKIKASQKKLYTGGDVNQEGVTGFVNEHGVTDRNGGKGHPVEGSNLVLGGKEFVVAEGPAHEFRDTLIDMNAGRLTGKKLREEVGRRGLYFAMDMNEEHEQSQAIINELTARNRDQMISEAIDNSVTQNINRLIEAIHDKPDSVAYTPGQIIRKESKNGLKIIQTEADWRWTPEPRKR